MPFILKHTHPQEVPHYYVASGALHFSDALQQNIHLTTTTTPDIKKARRFETAEDANLVLARAANPVGWELVTE